MITLFVNNQPLQIPLNSNLQDLLQHWPNTPINFALALNGNFVPRSSYGQTHVHPGDRIDLVVPVSGG